MKTALIIHGAFGSPGENWFPWLQHELEQEGYSVFVPQFPTPEKQTLGNWIEVFSPYEKQLNEESIIIAHSIGPAFVLRILEHINIRIAATYLVAPFIELLGNPDVDEINKTFVARDFDWMRIQSHCKRFVIFASDNDPYVPLGASKKVAKALGVEVQVVPSAGHFNADAGYTTFPGLLAAIKT